MITDTFAPIFDEETGEVLAASEEDRQFLINTYAADLVAEAEWRIRATKARRALGLLMRVGDACPVKPGWAVLVKPPATPARRVVTHAIDEHAEALLPLGLGPREETKVVTTYPKVSELTSPKAREALARVGLTPELLLHQPEPGDPQIIVVAPEAD